MMTLGFHDMGHNGAYSEGLLIVAHHVRVPHEYVKTHHGKGRPISSIIKDRESDPERSAALAAARKKLARLTGDADTCTISALARLRLSKGLSQNQLAAICNTQQSYIAKIEKGGADIRAATVLRLSKALGVSCDQIIEAAGVKHE